jgi:hypothetical protein
VRCQQCSKQQAASTQHFNAGRADARCGRLRERRVPPTKSLNKLAAVSVLHEAAGWWWMNSRSFAWPRECFNSRPFPAEHRSSLPSPSAMSCQRVPFPTAHLPIGPQLAPLRPGDRGWRREAHRQSATTVGRPMTRSGNNRRRTPVERALELPLSTILSDVENANNDNARSKDAAAVTA